jgi:hypothetical protein
MAGTDLLLGGAAFGLFGFEDETEGDRSESTGLVGVIGLVGDVSQVKF